MTVTSKGKGKAPISSHPVFPAIVALWFAALLGLGSMVLPVVLLEKLIDASGLAAALPAAQPPLGVTAQILVALAAAGIGAIAGLYIAHKVAAAQTAPAPRRRAGPRQADDELEAAAKRPISARDELGVDGLDAPVERAMPPIAGRRRALSITDESQRSDFLESAPVPGCNPDESPLPVLEDDPLDLGDFAEPEDDEPEDQPPEMAAFGSASLSGAPLTPGVMPMALGQFGQREQARPEPAPAEAQRFAAPSASAASPEDIRMSYSASAEPPNPFAGPEAEGHRFAAPEPTAASSTDPAGELAPGPAAVPATDLAARPLRELGTVELVERFALALQHRAEVEDSALELPAFKAGAPFAPEPVEPEEPAAALEPEPAVAAEAPIPQSFAAPPVPEIPAALRPIGFDEDEFEVDSEEPIAGLSLSLDQRARPFARPADPALEPDPPAAPREIGEDGGEDEERDGYSSLLAMKSPLGANREFVRVEDEDEGVEEDAIEPVVVFPGQQQQRRAAPASDGPTRDPLTQASAPKPGFRPFDAPAEAQSPAPVDFADPAMPTTPPAKKADSGETERALREALEKLQRMSGVA